MYVVPISTLLAPSFGRFRAHEELKAAGALVEYHEAVAQGKVLFISHTWLRRQHPDNAAGDKFALLRAVLQRAVTGKLDIAHHWMCELAYKKAAKKFRLRAADLKRDLSEGFVFFGAVTGSNCRHALLPTCSAAALLLLSECRLFEPVTADFMSIPQANPEAQQRAVASLVSYVSSAAYFMCLASSWRHEDGSLRDELAWGGRGWCRMEMTSNALSPSSKPLIVARSPSSIETFPPCGHLGRDIFIKKVGHGAFTVEEDKARLAPYLRDLIESRKALAFAEKDLHFARTLHAKGDVLLDGCGLDELGSQPLDAWMASMQFETPFDNVKTTGLSPLVYACMSGRCDLVEALLERGAPINAPARCAEARTSVQMGMCPLTFAATGGHSDVVRLLLERRANPRQAAGHLKITPLHYACTTGEVDGVKSLMAHDPSLANLLTLQGEMPFVFASIFGQSELLPVLRDEYPEAFAATNANPLNQAGVTMLTAAITNGAADIPSLEILLDAGVPVNSFGRSHGFFGTLVKASDVAASLRPFAKTRSIFVNFSYLSRTTALHAAAYVGAMGTIDLLLNRGANVNSTDHPKRMTPLHLAAIGGHADVASALLGAGATPDVKDANERTPAAWATRLGHDTVRRLLKSGYL